MADDKRSEDRREEDELTAGPTPEVRRAEGHGDEVGEVDKRRERREPEGVDRLPQAPFATEGVTVPLLGERDDLAEVSHVAEQLLEQPRRLKPWFQPMGKL